MQDTRSSKYMQGTSAIRHICTCNPIFAPADLHVSTASSSEHLTCFAIVVVFGKNHFYLVKAISYSSILNDVAAMNNICSKAPHTDRCYLLQTLNQDPHSHPLLRTQPTWSRRGYFHLNCSPFIGDAAFLAHS